MNDIPRNAIDGDYLNEEAHHIRWRKTIEFLAQPAPAGMAIKRGLDLGGRSPLTDSLEQFFRCPFDNTTLDLDIDPLEGRYGVVTAFEVIEHLFNPLNLLLQVRKLLEGEDARLFLSMPLRKPGFLASPGHFHEMSLREARLLFMRSGFTVVRSACFRIRAPMFYLTGFKPLMRAFYEKVQIYELTRS
jgi:hypothetical protein